MILITALLFFCYNQLHAGQVRGGQIENSAHSAHDDGVLIQHHNNREMSAQDDDHASQTDELSQGNSPLCYGKQGVSRDVFSGNHRSS